MLDTTHIKKQNSKRKRENSVQRGLNGKETGPTPRQMFTSKITKKQKAQAWLCATKTVQLYSGKPTMTSSLKQP